MKDFLEEEPPYFQEVRGNLTFHNALALQYEMYVRAENPPPISFHIWNPRRDITLSQAAGQVTPATTTILS